MSELARSLLMYAVDSVLVTNGNSYVCSATEQWLEHAASFGAYPAEGPFIGSIREVRERFHDWVDANGGLPKWPDTPHWAARMALPLKQY